jgi:acyl dehydratase
MSAPDGPYFDDLTVGQILAPAPTITIGAEQCAVYDQICGDRLALPRSRPLTRAVTGVDQVMVNPGLVIHMAIGQSTVATRHVIANLFYRGVRIRKHIAVGATIGTTVEIAGLSEATRRADRAPRGKVLLRMITTDDTGDVVLDFERCALLPFRDPTIADSGHHQVLPGPESALDLAEWREWVPTGWDLGPLGPPSSWPTGETRGDTHRHRVSRALDLVELTQNQALAHRDPAFGQDGRRLVYGGHTIALGQDSLSRLLPNIATVIGWRSCDHLGPVFEDETLECSVTLVEWCPVASGRLLAFEVDVDVVRPGVEPQPVLDWQPVVYAP